MKTMFLITKYFALKAVGKAKVTMSLKDESPVAVTTELSVH